MKAVFFALLLLSAPAFASQPSGKPNFWENILKDVAIRQNGLWIYPDTSSRNDGSRHFRFSIIPNEYTGSAQLEILIDAPDWANLEPLALKFDYDGIEYPITDYVYRSGNQYVVYLPQLEANRKIEFSLGLQNTSFAHYRVSAILTVDNGQKSAEWLGWIRRKAGS